MYTMIRRDVFLLILFSAGGLCGSPGFLHRLVYEVAYNKKPLTVIDEYVSGASKQFPVNINEYDEVEVDGRPCRYTALHMAAMWGQTDLAKKLVEHNANIHLRTHQGRTALHLAIASGVSKVAEDLINKRASVQVPDFDGRTPMHFAAMTGNLEMMKKLAKKGASRVPRDKYDATPSDYAQDFGYDEAAKWLAQRPSLSAQSSSTSKSESSTSDATASTTDTPLDDIDDTADASTFGAAPPLMTSRNMKRMVIPREKQEEESDVATARAIEIDLKEGECCIQ